MTEVVEVPRDVFDALMVQVGFLDALHAGGVDNWDYYDEVKATFMENMEGTRD